MVIFRNCVSLPEGSHQKHIDIYPQPNLSTVTLYRNMQWNTLKYRNMLTPVWNLLYNPIWFSRYGSAMTRSWTCEPIDKPNHKEIGGYGLQMACHGGQHARCFFLAEWHDGQMTMASPWLGGLVAWHRDAWTVDLYTHKTWWFSIVFCLFKKG